MQDWALWGVSLKYPPEAGYFRAGLSPLAFSLKKAKRAQTNPDSYREPLSLTQKGGMF